MEAFIRSDVRRVGIIYTFSRGLTRRLKCQTRSGREHLSPFAFPSRNLNSGKTSLVLTIIKSAALPSQDERDSRERGTKKRMKWQDDKWQDETLHGRRYAIATSGVEGITNLC